MTPPDSGEALELQRVFGEAIDGAWHIALRTRNSSMDTACGRTKVPALHFLTGTDTRARVWCVACVNARPAEAVFPPSHVSIPIALAQRILAELDKWADYDGGEARAIVDELRAIVERKT